MLANSYTYCGATDIIIALTLKCTTSQINIIINNNNFIIKAKQDVKSPYLSRRHVCCYNGCIKRMLYVRTANSLCDCDVLLSGPLHMHTNFSFPQPIR